jgi:hypothetical protein
VTVFITTDTAKRVADFSAKSVNLTWLFLPEERDQLKKSRPDAQYEETQGIGGYIYVRTDKPPFNDKRVRQAISMGLDRKAIRDAISKGEGIPDQLYHVGYPFARKVEQLPQGKYWEHNPGEARKLLDAALGAGTNIDTTWDHADGAISHAGLCRYSDARPGAAEGHRHQHQGTRWRRTRSTSARRTRGTTRMGHSPRAVAYWLDYITERFTMKPKRGRINLSYVNDPKLEALMDKQRGQFVMESGCRR